MMTATNTHLLAGRPLSIRGRVQIPGIEATAVRRSELRPRLLLTFGRIVHMAVRLQNMLASCGNPAFFQLERRGPTQLTLSHRQTYDPGSFWMVTDQYV